MTTLAALQSLLAEGESETLEFKRSTGELREAMQSLCALLNHRGGAVILGVSNDGRIRGQQVTNNSLRDIAAAVRDIDPAPQVKDGHVGRTGKGRASKYRAGG